ncbi:MAG TPA: hypothetical protein VLY83_00460 [Methanoregula sp.]|nr:hypothetical protein [Methanoregula sp.]
MPGMKPAHAAYILVLVAITIAVAILMNPGGPAPGPGSANGTLAGNVSIGPLCPVEPCRVSHAQELAAYAAHPLVISTAGGTVVATVTADPDTGYSVSLGPGVYVIGAGGQGTGGSRDLPGTVTIVSGRTVRLNVSIDTGIR